MTISNLSGRTANLVRPMLDLKSRLDDLQRQIGTGQKATTYAGLGVGRGMVVSLSAQLSAIGSYHDTMTSIGVRISVGQTALSRMSAIGHEVKSGASMPSFEPDSIGQTTMQKTAMANLAEMVGLLNGRAGDRYLFAGKSGDTAPVASIDHILDGNGARAGLRQIISERNQADGVGGTGRLVVSSSGPGVVDLAEDAISPFGLKLDSLVTTSAGAVVTAPAGSPATESVDLSAATVNAGDTVTFQFKLPDGTIEPLVLTATTDTPPKAGQFTIGATPALTATNLQASLTTALGTLSNTKLQAASTITASHNFFDMDASNPPQRVQGPPPFSSATALVDGTAADTVMWYTGEAGTGSARSTATARVDETVSVSYGMRANEQGIRWVMEHVAVAAVMTYSHSDANAEARARAVNERLVTALEIPTSVQKIEDIDTELASAQLTMAAVKTRQQQTKKTMEDVLYGIQGIDEHEVSAQILAVHTQLQATLQTTSMLYQTSLVNFL